eukprot:266719-Chlamydomonas_euryale.AAC.2
MVAHLHGHGRTADDLEEAIKQKLEELQSEWRRNQRASAPPIITANQVSSARVPCTLHAATGQCNSGGGQGI